MTLLQAKLIKRKTADGLMEIEDDIPLGKIYYVDIDSIRKAKYLNVHKDTYHYKEVIDTQDESGRMLPLPLECLQVIYEKSNLQ